jgi:hypothetical protein
MHRIRIRRTTRRPHSPDAVAMPANAWRSPGERQLRRALWPLHPTGFRGRLLGVHFAESLVRPLPCGGGALSVA